MLRVRAMKALVLAVMLLGCARGAPATTAPEARFTFHSGAWLNLHHVLWGEAIARDAADHGRRDAVPALEPGELRADEAPIWAAAVEVYAQQFAKHDFTFEDDMARINNGLSALPDDGDARTLALPPGAADALATAMPIYRAHWWAAHDRANRAWIAAVQPLLASHGAAMSRRLARIYHAAWPAAPLRVDVVRYASWSGAYTTLGPDHLTIASVDRRNQGSAALEILLHEASHAIIDPLRTAIAHELAAQHKDARDLWHAVLFASAGAVVAQGIPGHVPYAEREGLTTRAWPQYRAALQAWAPYVDGRLELAAAVRALVTAL